MKFYQRIANQVSAYHTVMDRLRGTEDGSKQEVEQKAWARTHREALRSLMREHAPRGSGLDKGTNLDLDLSTCRKLVLTTAFHHMNDAGFYVKWTDHKIIVTADLLGLNVKVMGENYREIKDFLYGTFYELGDKEI